MNSFVSQAEQFGNKKIDIIICNNEPWFKGKNIAIILGYENTTKALRDNIDVDDKLSLTNLCKKLGPGGPTLNIIKMS